MQPSAQPRLAPAQASPAQARSAQPSSPQPGQSLGAGLAESFAKAFPKAFSYRIQTPFSAAITLRFWSAFGSFGATVSLFWRFSVRVWPVSGRPAAAFPRFEGVGLIAEARSPKPSAQPRLAPAQASPAQASSARPSAKGFSYRIQRSHFRPRDGSFFGAFLARLGPPCRCVSLWSPAQAGPASSWPADSDIYSRGFLVLLVFGTCLARVRPPCRCVSLF